MPDAAQQIAKLREQLNQADRLYRLGQETGMSDIQWDHTLKQLEELETQHPDLATPDSPTQRVGGEPIDGFKTKPHSSPMLSIDNTYNRDELSAWYQRTCKLADSEQLDLVLEPKVDGVALALRYEQGQLVQALTRLENDAQLNDLNQHPHLLSLFNDQSFQHLLQTLLK